MTQDFRQGSITAPSDVLTQELPDDETIFLNLATEEYFGLDSVGTAMYRALVECGTFEAARQRLQLEFDVDPTRLRRDLRQLMTTLIERGLLEHRAA